MRLSELSDDQLAAIRTYRYDGIVEKHEGPWNWSDVLEYEPPEFLMAGKYAVLLPIEAKNHANVTVLRVIPSADGDVLTIFLRDTSFYEGLHAGFLAVCERVSGQDWFVATVYHEWFDLSYRT